MTVRITASNSGPFARFIGAALDDLAAAVTGAVGAATDGMKDDLRAQAAATGLGQRFGQMLRGDVYPRGGRVSLQAAGEVRPNGRRAEMLFKVYSEGTTIRGKGGQWLAIPTPNVPLRRGQGRGGGSKRMTPVEVEAAFNQELRFAYGRKAGTAVLIMDEAVKSRSKAGGYRPRTAGRRSRKAESVVMFVLRRSVSVQRRLQPEKIVEKWAGIVPALIDGLMQGKG